MFNFYCETSSVFEVYSWYHGHALQKKSLKSQEEFEKVQVVGNAKKLSKSTIKFKMGDLWLVGFRTSIQNNFCVS